MVVSQPKSFRDAIKPLVYFNCLAGLGALRQPDHSDAVYFFMSFYTVVANLVSWTAIYVTLNSMEQVIDFDDASPMVLTMYRALVCVNSFIAVIAPLLVWLQRKGVKECLQKMPILDDTLKSVLGVEKEYTKLFISLSCRLIAIGVFVLAVEIWDTAITLGIVPKAGSILMFFSVAHCLHHPILVIVLLDINFCTFVGYLGNKFRGLNRSLVRLGKKPATSCPSKRLFIVRKNVTRPTFGNEVENSDTKDSVNQTRYLLREIRKTHLELSQISEEINSTFGIQNLLSTGISFAMTTGLLYNTYSAFSWESFSNNKMEEVVSAALWIVIYASKIVMVNHFCWSASSEAKMTGEVVYDLLDSNVDEKLGREIQEFAVQMLKNPVRFNACGFFTLDYSFVQGVIGSITTYLVILIQMGNSSETTASNPRHNVSGM